MPDPALRVSLLALVDKWLGQKKGWLQEQPNYSKSQVYSACADELAALLRAEAPPPESEVYGESSATVATATQRDAPVAPEPQP